ncbi:hypothetical protein BGZ58_002783 [Dissophora ornata]|nr:hypothetical protein BGZ58_002783 [Dissophora ornata]
MNKDPGLASNAPPPKHHPLLIPEIMLMIVCHLAPKEILICRGVSKEWREIFAPFLELHAIYWNHGAIFKAKFEEQLETLGQYVQSLKQVYPIQADLERIQRTCPDLSHIGFFMRDREMLRSQALIKFLEGMLKLERIDVFSHHDQLVTAFLFCLATYQPVSSVSSIITSDSKRHPVVPLLRRLEIGNATHSRVSPSMDWTLLEVVLKKHPLISELTLRDTTVREGSRNSSDQGWSPVTRSPLGSRIQRNWNTMLDRIAASRVGGGGVQAQYSSPVLSTTTPGTVAPVIFDHIQSITLHNIHMSEELFINIVSRCPALKTLDLNMSGSELSMLVWPECLSYCRQLTSITIGNEYGGTHMDIAEFWALAPPTLTTFHVPRSSNADIFFPAHSLHSSLNKFTKSDLCPGSTLVSLELCIGIRVVDKGVRYVMAHCRSLERLVIGVQYFVDWEEVEDSDAFPNWACGHLLKRLELRSIYRRYDQHFDERTHDFMRRLEDLKVLESLILPAKLLCDLSESQHEDYAAFKDLLDQLDLRAVLRDQEKAQMASSYVSSLLLTETASTIQQTDQLQQTQQQQQGHVWSRDGSSPLNVIPPMPSVQEVTLTSTGNMRFQMQMRYLHILMEALPNLKTIWTAIGLFDMDCIPRFKHIHGRFQELYGPTNVQLNLGIA